jgi:hypothetical protein
VKKVDEVLKKSQKHPVDFYTELNMRSKEHAEAWLKNAKKTISTRNRMRGGRKTRNARKKTMKTRK